MQMKTWRDGFLLAAVFFACAAALAVAAPSEPSVVTDAAAVTSLLQRFDEAQMRTQTMIASFVERKRLHLLVDEQVQTGTFLYTKPSQFLWEYSQPDGKVILIDSEQLLVYYPNLKKAEEIDISRYSKRILRFFGFGQTTADRIRQDGLPVPAVARLPRRARGHGAPRRIGGWVDRRSSLGPGG